MKEVMIILRPKMYFITKETLVANGFHSMTVRECIGRGKKPVPYDLDENSQVVKHRLVAKKIIDMYIRDEDVDFLIETVVEVNKTNHAGDGKIFIMPCEDAVRVRTDERGDEAIM